MKTISLFSKRDLYLSSCDESGLIRMPGKSQYRQRIARYNNLHLIDYVTLIDDMPVVAPYNGDTSMSFLPITDWKKVHDNDNVAGHTFLHDIKFAKRVWFNLERTTYNLQYFKVLVAPDFSMYVDAPMFYNYEAIYKNRFVAAFWQAIGYTVIPSASWGNADSFSYAFKGLPRTSVIATTGTTHNSNADAKLLWKYGLQELESQLEPTLIIVYGVEEDTSWLTTPVLFKTDYITNRFRK